MEFVVYKLEMADLGLSIAKIPSAIVINYFLH